MPSSVEGRPRPLQMILFEAWFKAAQAKLVIQDTQVLAIVLQTRQPMVVSSRSTDTHPKVIDPTIMGPDMTTPDPTGQPRTVARSFRVSRLPHELSC